MITARELLSEVAKEDQKDLVDVLQLCERDGYKLAFHRDDADGIISGAMAKVLLAKNRVVPVPLSYALLRKEKILSHLGQYEWIAICDLIPFNLKPMKGFYCDHHTSSLHLTKKANRIIFDPEAPSAANLLFDQFSDDLKDFEKLVSVVQITDTANFQTEPPTKVIDPNLATFDDITWLVNDACKGAESVGEVLELFDVFVREKDEAIFHPLLTQMAQRIVGKRHRAMDIAKTLESAPLIIIRTKRRSIYDRTIIYQLLARKEVKVGISLRERTNDGILSLRVSKNLSQNEYDLYRVDQLASLFGGGGHKVASGAIVSNVDRAIERILDWGRKRNLIGRVYSL
ncbi:MAG: bifunctional oligoribonuclease/PAP phosphatase NrnA [Promethearchaeota archaeon]